MNVYVVTIHNIFRNTHYILGVYSTETLAEQSICRHLDRTCTLPVWEGDREKSINDKTIIIYYDTMNPDIRFTTEIEELTVDQTTD